MNRAAATVYLAMNQVNGDSYVGVTRFTPEHRWEQHVVSARHPGRSHLHRAVAKYGADNFTVEALISCLNRDDAGMFEQATIQRLAPVYNMTNGGEATRHRTMTPDVRQKMRIAATGRIYTAEEKAANSERKKLQWRTNPSFRAAALKGLARARTKVDRSKRSAAAAQACRERIWTPESRAKLSAAQTGRVHSQRTIETIRAKKFKPVTCRELDIVFGCVDEAAVRLGMSPNSIYKVCSGVRSCASGLTFSYKG